MKITWIYLLLLLLIESVLTDLWDYSDEDEIDCPSEDDRWLEQKQIPWGKPNRAMLTCPSDVYVTESAIPGASLGVIAKTFIPKYTWLAEYEGEVIIELDDISDYAWTIWRDGKKLFYIDAYDEKTSNWLRWINCSRHYKEENVLFYECRGKAFYLTSKDIYPGQELLIYYGNNYARDLDIDVDRYYDKFVDIEKFRSFNCWNLTNSV